MFRLHHAGTEVKIDFSPTCKARVAAETVGGTLFCIAAALLVDSVRFDEMTEAEFHYALAVNTLLPTVLAAPLLWLLLNKMRQLAIAHRELGIVASTDNLTQVPNRGAFRQLVDDCLRQSGDRQATGDGAFFIIDADHFKAINDRFGHQNGDAALKIIARTIQDSIRQDDIVGRIGGEEFGVFLPKTGMEQAVLVAERIRRNISRIEFPPDVPVQRLSVSVGGAAFERQVAYEDLFRVADECLYAAKAGGRNQVRFEQLAA